MFKIYLRLKFLQNLFFNLINNIKWRTKCNLIMTYDWCKLIMTYNYCMCLQYFDLIQNIWTSQKKSIWPLEGMFSLNYYKWRGKLHYSFILFLKTLLREKVCGSGGRPAPPPSLPCYMPVNWNNLCKMV